MLKAILSFISLAAIMVTTANFLVERGFTPDKVSSKDLGFNNLARTLETEKVEVTAGPTPLKKSTKPHQKRPVFNKPEIELLELTEADFVPMVHSSELSEEVTQTNEEINFASVKKVVDEIEVDLKAQYAKRSKLKNRKFKLQNAEINGAEPINLYGFKEGKQIEPTSLAANFLPINTEKLLEERKNIIIAKNKKQNNDHDKPANSNGDRISTGLAATEKSVTKKVSKDIVFTKSRPTSSSDNDEELVFFDYSSSESLKQEIGIKNEKKSVKPTVAKTAVAQPIKEIEPAQPKGQDKVISEILKKMGERPNKKTVRGPKDHVTIAQAKAHVPNKQNSLFTDKNAFLEKNMNTQNYHSTYKLSIQSRSIGNSKTGKVQDFDVRFADDINDIRQSDSDGSITFAETLNSPYAVRKGTVMARGHYPMTVDFTFEGQPVNSILPLITEDSLNKTLHAQGLTGLGGHILVQLDKLTEDVELSADAIYEKKIFLDRALRVVERSESDYHYIMFLGVEPGNKIISFKTYKRDVTSKIIHVAKDEIYFDFNYYASERNDEFELFEDHLLSKESAVLALSEKDITDLQFDSFIEQLTLNRYQVKKALYPVGTRKYFELNHMETPIFIGRWNSDYVDVPGQQYRDFSLAAFGINRLDYQCMVQINLEKQAKDIFYEGKSFRGPMVPQPRILDTDGIFYKDISDQSKRVFLLGEMQGALSVRIDYVDGSTDFLQTFCSAGGWVVEQL